jgi:hypothetical protein
LCRKTCEIIAGIAHSTLRLFEAQRILQGDEIMMIRSG